MKKYFTECKTLDDAKNLFNKLVFELHPDTSGSDTESEFIKMYDEFKKFKPSATSTEGNEAETFDAEKFYNVVQHFAHLQNVVLTFVGSFIWLEDAPDHEGATKAQKELIKEILIEGYNTPRFAFKRLKWYLSPEGYKQSFKSKKSFEEIKRTYGAQTYKATNRAQLA